MFLFVSSRHSASFFPKQLSFLKPMSYLILLQYNDQSQEIKIGSILICNLQAYSDSASYINDVLCSQRKSRMGDFCNPPFIKSLGSLSLVSLSLGKFLSVSLIFITFVFLCSIGQIFCRFFLRLGSCDVSSCLVQVMS